VIYVGRPCGLYDSIAALRLVRLLARWFWVMLFAVNEHWKLTRLRNNNFLDTDLKTA